MNLSNIAYSDECYTIVFIAVSHNGEMFSFINAIQNRFVFFWNRWKEWKGVLAPYTFHAFLVKAYNTRSDSGMGFTPVQHLCEFAGIHEARTFNAAYLTKYNKIYKDAGPDEVTEMSVTFAEGLIELQNDRQGWLPDVERAAYKMFSNDVMSEFFSDTPIPLKPSAYRVEDLFDSSPLCLMLQEWARTDGKECPVYNLN